MATKEELLSLLFGFFSILHSSVAFNFDTKVPIVKTGSADSFFGFSVAQHQIELPNSAGAQHVFIVGAPQDNITDPGVPASVAELVRPGAVYKCPFTSLRDDCDWLEIDAEEPYDDEQKDGQWMGVSVASTGTISGGAVACAHRFTQGGDQDAYRWGLGQCISLRNSLDEGTYYSPCRGLDTEGMHEDYGLCQAGSSVALDQDGELLMGAPGSRTWRGAAFKNTIKQGFDSDLTWYRSPADDPTRLNPGPEPAVKYYSYLGMSSQIANLDGSGKVYIAGAPRSNDTGQLLLFTLGSDALEIEEEDYLSGEKFGSWFGCDFTVLDLNNDGLQDIVVGAPFYNDDQIGGAVYVYLNSPQGITSATVPTRITSRAMTRKECEQLDCENARFGFSVKRVGDIDLDGFEDFAVGAPYEGNGAVYIFRGQGSSKGVDPEYSQRIAAEDLLTAGSLSSFGYSLSGGMDMDGNGYPDLVVGNFESDKALVLRTRPVVKVDAVMHSYPLRIDPDDDRCYKDAHNNNCFEMRLCFNFTAEPKSEFTESMEIDYRLEAEIFTGKRYSRVYLKGASKPHDYLIDRSITLDDQFSDQLKCKSHLVYISNSNKDFLNAIQFRLNYTLSDREQIVPVMNEGDAVPNINTYPILNAAKAEIFYAVPFEKNCGDDETCHSDLAVTPFFALPNDEEEGIPVLKIGQEDEIRMTVVVRNNGEDAHESNIYLTLPEYVSYRGTSPAQGEDSSPACIYIPIEGQADNLWTCPIGNPLKEGQSYSFIVRMNAKAVSSAVRRMTFKLKVNTTSTEVNAVDDTYIQDVRVIVETNLFIRGGSKPSEVFYSGEVKGESAIQFEEEIGSQIEHSYEVKNDMSGVVRKTLVTIKWPYEVHSSLDHGKHLLYLMEPPLVDAPGVCHVPDGFVINPLNIQEDRRLKLANQRRPSGGGDKDANYTLLASTDAGDEEGQDTGKVRRKREDVIRSDTIKDGSGRDLEVVTMDCRTGTAKCFEIRCEIGTLINKQSVLIKLRARLWNHTFVEDYKNVDRVNIYSSASLMIDPDLNIKETNMRDNEAEALTRAIPDIRVAPDRAIPWWIILIAIVGALILLVIIVLVLWKCGFFKRKRVEDNVKQYKGKVQKQRFDDENFS